MTLEIFTNIGGFEFQELLGKGGFGAVIKAIDKLGREVAIKVLTLGDETPSEREASNKAFLREATTLAKLNHPNIVTVYSYDIDSAGQPYLVMEFLPGEPLSKIIRSGRELHLAQKLSIILQAAKALQFAHNAKPQPVVHRDVKPHNIMVMGNGTVKLIDFGIAQVIGSSRSRSMNVAGSLPYMSPEHWQPPVTPWGDVFSLGVVLFELLTGSVPYATEWDTVPVAYQKLVSSSGAPPLSELLPNAPPRLAEIVAKALNKHKAGSYEDAQHFWLDLSRLYNRIKPQFLAKRMQQSREAKNAGDFDAALHLVQEMLAVDPASEDAAALQAEINQAIQQNQRSAKVHAICGRVEEALLVKRFDLAQMGLDEARAVAPESPTVALLLKRVQQARELHAKIENLIVGAEKYHQSGKWEDARRLVDEALVLDRANTLALNLRAQIERLMAAEHELCEDARRALDQLRFEEAFHIIRRAEALAPDSERVKALKEFAVSVRRQQVVRDEVENFYQRALRLFNASDLLGARRELQSALSRHPDQKKLLDLRDTVELKISEAQREQFIGSECEAAERESRAGNFAASLVRLDDALRRFPDERRLREAKERITRQSASEEAERRRQGYLEQARASLKVGDAPAAIITAEMGLAAFPNDKDMQGLLRQARAAASQEYSASRIVGLPETVRPEAKGDVDFPSHAPSTATPPVPAELPPDSTWPETEIRPAIRLKKPATPLKNFPHLWFAGAGLILILLIALIVHFSGSKPRTGTSKPLLGAEKLDVVLTIDAVPWATIESISPAGDNDPNHAIAIGQATPVRLPATLVRGDYIVHFTDPNRVAHQQTVRAQTAGDLNIELNLDLPPPKPEEVINAQ